MSFIDLTLGGTSLTTTVEAVSGATVVVRTVNRPLSGEIRAEFVNVPGRDGAWVFDEQPGDILLTFEMSILVDDIATRRAAIAALRSWAQTPSGRLPLIVSDESDRHWDAKIPAAGAIEDDEHAGMATITFSCRPFMYSTSESSETIEASGSPDSGTFSESLSYNAEPVIEITPTNGTITSFVLTVNGAEIAWQDGSAGDPNTIAQDETITISTISQTVTLGVNVDVNLTGAFDPDDVDMAAVAITGFPEIVNGSNAWSLSWTGTATTVDIDFAWRERFV